MLPIHLGLEGTTGFLLYMSAIACLMASIFWRPIVGIFYLLPLIPLQTIRYRLNEFPLGGSILGVMLLGVAIGIMRRKQPILPRTTYTTLVCIYGFYTLVSVFLGSFYLGVDLPLPHDPRFEVWQDYIMMSGLLLIVAALQPTAGQIKAIVIVMCVSVLMLDRNFWSIVSGRDFSQFSWDLREGGAMGYAGTNGLAAFEAQFTTFLLALGAFETKRLMKLAFYGLALYSGLCLMYSLSRGGYISFLAGWLFIGLFKQRKLLIAMIAFGLTWTSLVPNAVRERVTMTYDEQTGSLDHSSETRVTLWEDAMEMVRSNLLMGTGFNTYAYMHRVRQYEDTHNFYLKVLVETGILGLAMFLWLLGKFLRSGFQLFRHARDPFFASLGLGLMGWVVAAIVANFFGDRWTYMQVGGYMWILAGLVCRAKEIESQDEPAASEEPGLHAELTPAVAAI
jgi:putative inorganic carbon (hco3(-)) transporter